MGIINSEVVPTEYDIVQTDRPLRRVELVDDRGRCFHGLTLKQAFRRAERAQDPSDPIHHPPYPAPNDTPLP